MFVWSVMHIISEDENYFLMLLFDRTNIRILLLCSLNLPQIMVNVMLILAGAGGQILV